MSMEKLDYILDRRSIRRFTDEKIDNNQIKIILTAAMYAPSAVNMQPWHFVVIHDRSMMEKVMEIHPYARMLQTASHAVVVCGDELPKKKPDPMPLLHVAEKLGVRPEESLMLGDSMSDVKAARAAGFDIICMSYGYNHGEDIRDYNPDAVVDSMDEVKGLIDWS